MASVVFLGTPEAAVPTLNAVADMHDVKMVITQPDRPKGRSKKPQPPPVKTAARRLDLEVGQPRSSSELLDSLGRVAPIDVGIVVAFGRIIRPDALRVPKHGFLNVHFSLLPRWRGAAPVARALMAGDSMTGVTVMKLDEGLDTGPILTAQAIDVTLGENAGDLTNRLSMTGTRLLIESIVPYLEGGLEPVPQSDEGVTYADRIESDDRPIHPSEDVVSALNRVRALAPDPGATLVIDGVQHKVLELRMADASPPSGRWQLIDGVPVAGLGDGGVALVSIQPPGKRPMRGVDWARGRRGRTGTVG